MDVRRRSKTPWEELKLQWYRSNSEWENAIRTRRVVTGRDGSKIAIFIDKNGRERMIPEQPRNLWPPPKTRNK